MATFQRKKLNWRFVSVVEMNINIIEYKPIKVRIQLPKPNTMIEFKNYNKSMRVPFVVYADFESFIKPINTCSPNPNESYTKQYQKHTPSSFCYYIKCFDEKIYQSKLVTFTTNKNNFNNAKICHICEKDLNEDRVRDHCHITGKYRGAAHSDCNLQFKVPKFIPVLFHNLSGYDSHLSIKKLSEGRKINCIPNNEEKYISFSKELKVNEFTNKEESFYSRLNNERISDEDYLHAQTVWKEFDCETFRDYLNLYNVSDVLLLADVLENFRDVCTKNYKLDPAWYFTAPGLAWDAALKITKVKLELLSNYDMIFMIKQEIRGGINANNLYGWAMSKPLPTHRFEWMNEEELKNWKSISCILEVNLEYPEHLHDLHNDYPLAPERLKIDRVEKLVTNLNHKKNYIIHYENLKLYERLGLKITKIHRGVKFEESPWLNLSKTLMYEFHYDYIKSKYEDRAKLLYTDTDSLIYEIKTKDFYADIANDIESKFDTSEFDKNHPAVRNGFKVGVNKKVLGMFKDESAGKQIAEFIGLRSKLYSFKIHGEDKKRCKGVKKNVVKNYITHEDYKDCLKNRKDQMRKMNVIRSHLHDVYTEEINKIALSAEDDKRVILEDGIHTLAYGHYKLKDKPNFSFQIDWKESDRIDKPNFSFQIDWK
ncbi:uncharacterized protein LOC136073101 [Hydra vulgaris]|uniref:uncharacterized protein LOC136073101 n=1 Tax=Hydra vulgaris TaxID=6087 RepID=UPI0032EA8948